MKPQKRRPRRKRDRLVLRLLIIVILVLAVFEGRLIFTMISHRAVMREAAVTSASNTAAASGGTLSGTTAPAEPSTEMQTGESEAPRENPGSVSGAGDKTISDPDSGSAEATLAGLRGGESPASPVSSATPTVSDPDSPAIVPRSDTSVDDSYFADAAFIGDSRMEGFRNASGITQGRFFTSIGMSLSSMAREPIISTSAGNITVAAALSGASYDKIYLMLGTNDLGEYDWDSFRDGFTSVMQRFQELQPGALIYVCSVIYVDEAKVPSAEYVNNANVDKINSILLEVCEARGYHYLDLNEIFTNGYGALLEDASSDGVHLYPDYCKQMLDYLKSHTVEMPEPETDQKETQESGTEEPETDESGTDAPKKS